MALQRYLFTCIIVLSATVAHSQDDVVVVAAGSSTGQIQAAIDLAGSQNKGLVFEAGVEYLTGELQVSWQNRPKFIDGRSATLKAKDANQVTILRLVQVHASQNSDPANTYANFYLRNLNLDSDNKASYAIHILGAQRMVVQNIRTSNSTSYGVVIRGDMGGKGVYYNRFADIHSRADANGFRIESLTGNGGERKVNGNLFSNCNVHFCPGIGVYMKNAESNSWVGGSIEKTGSHTMYLDEVRNCVFNLYSENYGVTLDVNNSVPAKRTDVISRDPSVAGFMLVRQTENNRFFGTMQDERVLTNGGSGGKLVNTDYLTAPERSDNVFAGSALGPEYRVGNSDFRLEDDGVTELRFWESGVNHINRGPTSNLWSIGVAGSAYPTTSLRDSLYIRSLGAPTNTIVFKNSSSGGSVGIGLNQPQAGFKLHVAGLIKCSGVDESSSRELKAEIKELGDQQKVSLMDAVLRMKPITYRLKKSVAPENQRTQIGFVAEDMPKLVSPDGKAVAYSRLSAYAIAAIQVQQAQLDEQTKQIDELKSLIQELNSKRDSN